MKFTKKILLGRLVGGNRKVMSERLSFYWISGTALSSKLTRASEVLSLIDSKRMIRTCVQFPLDLGLDMDKEGTGEEGGDQIYDPRFFLPLAAQICRPTAFVDRHLKLVESGILGKY